MLFILSEISKTLLWYFSGAPFLPKVLKMVFMFLWLTKHLKFSFSSVQFSSVHSPSHVRLFVTPWTTARPPCPPPTPRVYPNPCPLCQWGNPAISSSVVPFSSCPQSLPASGSFQISQVFASGGQSIGISASTSVLPMNT